MKTKPFKYEPEELKDKFEEYIDYCEDKERFPNIEGFCRYAKINKSTYYRYTDREEFKEAIEEIELIHEDEFLQRMVKAKNPVGYIVYAKNKLGYVDKKEIQTNTTTNVQITVKSKEQLVEDIMQMLPDNDVIDVDCEEIEEC